MSTDNAAAVSTYQNGLTGVATGKTGSYNFSNVRFYSYPSGSKIFKVCSGCDSASKYNSIGTDVYINHISFSNVNATYLNIGGIKRCLIWDTDGSFGQIFDGNARPNGGTIMYGYNHIKNFHQSACPEATTAARWDNTIYCDHTETVKRIVITNILPSRSFSGPRLKVTELANINDTTSHNISSDLYTSVTNYYSTPSKQSKEKGNAWSLPYLTGNIYNVWWGVGLDFSHLSLFTTPLYNEQEDGVIFKFNYTLNRELY